MNKLEENIIKEKHEEEEFKQNMHIEISFTVLSGLKGC